MKPSRDQRSYADQASIIVATALREKHCFHERKCRCFGRHRISSWLTLDALIHQGWTLTPPSGKEASDAGS